MSLRTESEARADRTERHERVDLADEPARDVRRDRDAEARACANRTGVTTGIRTGVRTGVRTGIRREIRRGVRRAYRRGAGVARLALASARPRECARAA